MCMYINTFHMYIWNKAILIIYHEKASCFYKPYVISFYAKRIRKQSYEVIV